MMVWYLRLSVEYSNQCIVLMLFLSMFFSLPLSCHKRLSTFSSVQGISNELEMPVGKRRFTSSGSSERRVAVLRRVKNKSAAVHWVSRHLMTSSENLSQAKNIPVQSSGGEFKDLADCATRKCRKYISQKSCVGKCNNVNYTACSCHSSCVLFNHCCNDFREECVQEFEKAQEDIMKHPGIYAECDSFLGFKVISNCSANSSENEKKLCLQEWNPNEHSTVLPVTDTNTSFHFKNVYCMKCWNITTIGRPWRADVHKPPEEIPPNPTLLFVLQFIINNTASVKWTLEYKYPMYSPANADDYPKNCTAMTLNHPDLGAMCLQENGYLLNRSCQGRCNSRTAFPCSCQPQCMVHETCCDDFVTNCVDNFIKGRDETVQNPNLFTICDKILRISVISHCPDSATKLSKRRCESRDPFVPKTFIPVTDRVTHRQFKNEFCWTCWNMKRLAVPWSAHARDKLIGYKPPGKAKIDILAYVLENHHLTYWFPTNYLPLHSCSRSSITCLMRQYYQIQPMPPHCSNFSSDSLNNSLHNFPSFSRKKPLKDCSCLSSCRIVDSCCEDYETVCGIEETRDNQMSRNGSQVTTDNDSQILSDSGSRVMSDNGNQVISANGSQVIFDTVSKGMSDNGRQVMSDKGNTITFNESRHVDLISQGNLSYIHQTMFESPITGKDNQVQSWQNAASSHNVGLSESISHHYNTAFVIIATLVYSIPAIVFTIE